MGTITAATDPDAGDTLTYTLSGADADKFNLDATSRVLSFKTAPNFEAPGSAAGTNAYSVTVTATDAGGLTATQTVTVNVTNVDDTPPNPPTINNFTDNVTPLTGTFNNGSRTNDPTPTLNITAEAASTIRVFLPGGQEVSGSVVTTGTTGNISTYTFTPSTSLSQDNYSFTATATDAAGNISNQSNPFTLTVDTTPPSAPIIVNFTDDVVPLTGTLDSGSVTNDSTPTLNITAESGSTVQIFRNGFSYGTAQESSTPGTYTFTTATLGSFTHQFTAQATDAAGNVGPSSATFSLTVEPPTYRRYNFTYSYGNGDSYSGYVYELEGTYSVGRLSGNFSNETNLATPTGFYTIDSLGETTTDSSFNKRVYLTRYTDSDTGFGSTTNLWPPSNSVSSYSGLGSEYGYAYDSNFFSADPYFTNYFEADLISNNVYFEFTYYYGASANSDYYKGYGYASRDYINAPGRYNALSSAQNDTGSTGYYDVTSVQSIFDFGLRNVNTYIWVNEYFDLETDQDGTGIGGYGKADYVWSYGGTTGLGSEEGYAYNLAFEGGDNQFNHLKSADIGTEKTFLSIRNQGNAWLQSRFEGNQGTTTNYNFEVVRRGSLNSPLSVNWTTQDFFSLSSANDFVGNTFPSGTVTFAPGESVKPFTVSVQGDNTIEFAEWFQARITNPNPSSITISQDYALARILNDDGLFWGWNFGDPHLVTLDGLAYDFMAVGEFVLIETTPGSDNPFQVQVRYEPFPGSDVASIATRMAVKLGERKIELRPGESPLLIDGSPVTIDPTLDGLDIDGDGSLDIERQSIQNGSKYVVTLNSLGEQVDLDIYDTFMDVNMLVAQSPEGSTRGFRGLLGDRNNNSADDLRGRDGTLYAQPVSFDQLYGTFANSWRVDPVGGTDGKDSLFTYSAGQGVGSFNREGFPKGVIDLNQVPADLLAAAQNAAVGITDPVLREAAIYDYFLTGDRNFISSAADSPAEPNRDQPETIDLNTAPVVTSVGVGATLESFTEGNSGSREVTFRIWRTNSTQTLTIDYRLEGSINAADLAPGTPFSGSVDFAQGETEKLVTVTVLGDRDIETDERLVLALAAGAQSRTIGSLESTIIAAGQAVTTITSDDLPPVTINQISGNNVVNAAEKIAGVSITGNATGLEQVRVTVAGLSKTVSVNAGTWSANFASQELPGDGSYNVEAIGIDSSGNQIDPVTRTLVLDATPPAPPVINPITGDNIINPAETTSGITITGTAEENTRVQLAFGGVTRTVTAIGGQWSTIIAANQLPNVNQALVTATATDTAGNTSAIAVREVRFNQAPSFAVPTATFDTAENNTSVGTITAATDPDTGDTLTYTLSGADADKFNIDSSNRFLSFKTPPNFEAPGSVAGTNTYSVTVTATDAGGLTATQTVTVNVTDVAEVGNPPVITSSSTFSLVENTTAVGTITATDADGNPLTYSISGGLDQSLFIINPNTGDLSFNTPPNFEAPGDVGTNNVYNLQIQVTDGNNPVTKDLIITVTNVNEAPSFAAPTATFPTPENTVLVGSIAATDPDGGDTLTYTLSGADADKFNVDSVTRFLSFNTAPNFEVPGSAAGNNTYSVTVTATDAGGLTATQTVTVNVTNVNEAPSFAAPTASFSTAENSTTVGTITAATDPDAGDTLTYTLSGADADKFNIDSSNRFLSFKTPPNFEAPGSVAGTNTYSVTVTATDAGGLTATQTVTVNVTDVAEVGNPPVITSSSTFSLVENTTAVGTITATDADGDSLTYSISGGADQNLFTINPNTGVLSFKTAPNFEAPGDAGTNNVYNLQVQVTDGNNPVTQDLIITVTNVNEAPSFAAPTATFSTSENSTSVGTITAATDPDAGDTLTYSLSGADADKFNFDATSRVLSFKTAPNFEAPGSVAGTNTYSVTVTATDAGGLTATQTVTVNVTDVAEVGNPPVITSSSTFSLVENTTAVGTITATDADGDSLTYSISGGADQNLFTINPNTGVLSFKTAPNFEAPGDAGTNNVYNLQVQVTDGNNPVTQDLIITVTNVNEAPSFAAPTATFSTSENTTSVGTITAATDPDAGDTLTYTLSGADADKFNIDSSNRFLSFKTPPNFEAPGSVAGTNTYSVTVTATDAGGLTATQTVTVNVTDVAEVGNPPVITSSSTFSLVENTTAVGTITATDADGDSLTYSISGGADQNLFTINPNTGVLSFKTAPNFEAPGDAGTNNVYNLQVRVTDGNNPVTQDLNITVTDVNEAPTAVSLTNTTATIAENSSTTNRVKVADINITDDALGTETITLTGADAASFEVDGNALYLKAGTVLNYEVKSSYLVTVNVDDTTVGNTPDVSTNFTLGVTNVNEAPVFSSFSFSVPENRKSVAKINVQDPEGDAITFALAGVDANLLSLDPQTGELTFKELPDFEKPRDNNKDNTYEVKITVTDSSNLSVTGDIPIKVTNVNEAPIAKEDFLTIFSATSGSIEPLKNDEDPDQNDQLKISSVTDGKHGKVEINVNGDQLKYTLLDAKYTGDDVFTYTISDKEGLTATANVRVNVTASNVIPAVTPVPVNPGNPLIPNEAGSLAGIVDQVSFNFLPGYNPTQARQTLQNTLGRTSAAFNNLFGLYEIDDATGLVNGIAPGAPGYAKEALSRAVSSFAVRAGGSGNGITGDVVVNGGKIYAPFVIANGGNLFGNMQDAINTFFQLNAGNSPATAENYTSLPVAYFSFGAANPDGAAHIRSFGNNIFGFEDLPSNVGVSDYDFNDTVFSFG
ncbi:cadherin domain-containing protein [Cylindrospermopsis raciborskii]|uniref:cadherin domain-containing protein n=1 Tax=Cylindrospermopsis raciborskii TaxID=77022 RepID=UPI0026F34789|nr:cadherin domain-containing protein [Cylindrospermopsis raciborskii]